MRGDKLQAAIDKARQGDTIIISGTCRGTFHVDQALTLRGTEGATLRGPGSGTVLTVGDPGTVGTTPGFTAQIRDLKISGGEVGVQVLEGSGRLHGKLRGVVITDNRTGIGGNWSDVTMDDSVVRGNQEAGIFAGTHTFIILRATTVEDNGGTGVSGGNQSGLECYDCVIQDNGGPGVSVGPNDAAQLYDSVIRRNRGGGVRRGSIAGLEIYRTRIVENTTAGNGGGIYLRDPSGHGGFGPGLTIVDSVVSRNVAGLAGGGIYVRPTVDPYDDEPNVLTRVTLDGNAAGTDGGGIYSPAAPLSLTDVTLSDNTPNDCTGC